MKPITIPPILGVRAAHTVRAWQQATDRLEGCSKAYADAQTAHMRAERELRELARAIAIVLETAAPPPTNAAGAHANAEQLSSDVILAWMQAGSPTDSEGNMLIPNGAG